MHGRCLLYYITDRTQFAGDEAARRCALFDKIREAVSEGVDYIQLREKDLSARDIEQLACEVVSAVQEVETERIKSENVSTKNGELRTRILVNSRTDVALASGADGVHLRSDDVSTRDVRRVVKLAVHRPLPTEHFLIAVSCHSSADVLRAEAEGADWAVFAPVFEKKDAKQVQPQGLDALREACGARIPVLALGGVTLGNAASCIEAGAAGIGGIRLFQENRIEDVVRILRSI
jgi:thiamine-phosphate pyrophosphorylase